jgi:hypothetical protein
MHDPLQDTELLSVREEIKAGLAKYQRTTGVQAAVQLASELFAYDAHPANRSAQHMVAQFARLQSQGVTPWDLLQRVTEVYACILKAPSGRFENTEVEAITIARSVMKITSMGRYRAQGHMLRTMGTHLREALGVFAIAFVRRLEQDKVAHRSLINQSTVFEEVPA